MRAARKVIGLLSVSILLTGCSQINQIKEQGSWEPTSTSLEVNKDGTLTETIIDTLGEAWYSGTELEQMIQSSVAAYNESHGEGAVTAVSYAEEGGQVKAVLTYKSQEDYAGYNNVPFYEGSMLGAQLDGYLFGSDFVQVSNGTMGERISNEEALSHKEYQVLIMDESHTVRVPGKIAYVSANAQVTDSRTAVPAGEGSTDEIQIAEDTSEQAAGEVSAEDMDKTYVYVIYEF